MADEELNPKMRFNPIWYQGWEFVEGSGIFEITEDLDMKGFGIKNVKDPVEEQDVVTKKYVDDAIANIQGGGGGGQPGPGGPTTANLVTCAPTSQIQATNVQAALEEISNEGAFVDKANTFTEAQTIAGATIKEEISAVPYGYYAPRSGKSTVIETQNSVNIKAHDLLFNGRPLGAGRVEYTPKSGGMITGSTVQEALESADDTIKAVQSAQGNYVEKSGLTADFSAGGHAIIDLKDGATATEAVNKKQLDLKADATELATAKQDISTLKQNANNYVTKTGGVLTGALDAGRQVIKNLGAPSDPNDAVRRAYVDDALGQLQGAIQGQLQWAGTYDCGTSQIVALSEVGSRVPDFAVNQNLPVITQANATTLKNHYFIVVNKAPATGAAPAPQQNLSGGDWIIADANGWKAIEMAKAVTAATVSFTPAGTIDSTDVQKAVEEVSGDVTAVETKVTALRTDVDAIKDGTTKIQAGNVTYEIKQNGILTGATVQDALQNADLILKSVRDKADANEQKIQGLTGGQTNFASKNLDNIFTASNTFTQIPTTEGTNTKTEDKQLANVKFVKDTIGELKAVSIPVDPQLTNITGATVQAVLTKADELIGNNSDYIVNNTSLVGTYDASDNKVLTAFGLGTGKITPQQPLPTPSDDNKNFVLVVKLSGQGVNPAPGEHLNSGDMIRSSGTAWEKIDASAVKVATDISITNIAGVNGTNVQEALQDLASKHGTIRASDVAVDAVNDLVGTNVQELLVTASTKIKTNEGNITRVENDLRNLSAEHVSFDNTQSQFPGSGVINTVQKALDGARALIQQNISSVNASNVNFTSSQGIQATNVAGALDELKQEDAKFVLKNGGVLEGPLNASTHQIQNLGAPQATDDAVSKGYVEEHFVKRDGGALKTNLDANNKKITNLAEAQNDLDATNKYYVDNAITSAGESYVTKSNGQLDTDLNANNKKITGLANPGAATDAANQQYVDTKVDTDIATLRTSLETVYLKLSGGTLTGGINMGGQRITNMPAPTDNNDAVRKAYVDGHFVRRDGGQITSAFDANQQYIYNLRDANSDGDAVNKRVLDRAIQGIQGQLVGKLTFCGTYNASTNRMAMVSTAGGTHGFTAGQPLPADASAIANCFVIVSVAGTGTGAAPAQRLGVGDICLAQGGSGWINIPIGSTRTADNVSITPIQALANTTNVQEALEALASRPAGGGASTAVQVAFTPAGEIEATNVQTALQEVDSETVKLAGNQTIQGNKTFASFTKFEGHSSGSIQIGATSDMMSYILWKAGDDNRAWAGFVSTQSQSENVFQFHIHAAGSAAQPAKFQFTKIMEYSSASILPTSDQQIASKKYVDQAITDAGSNYVTKTGGSLTGTLDANGQLIRGLPDPQQDTDAVRKIWVDGFFVKKNGGVLTGDLQCGNNYIANVRDANSGQDALNQRSGDRRYVMLGGGGQTITQRKAFSGGVDFNNNTGELFRCRGDRGTPCYFTWHTGKGDYATRYGYVGFESTTAPFKNTFRFNFEDAGDANNPTRFMFNQVIEYENNAGNRITQDNHLVTKKYVDDAVAANAGSAGGVSVVSATSVNVTTNFPGLNGKGTALYSHRLLKNDADGSILSAIFGLKLTITSAWTPTASNAPVQFVDGAHIPGLQYYQGLPIPPDTSLGGNYKTVAQIHLYRVVTTNGISLIQNDSPIKLGRIVCLNDTAGQGRTKLYLVVSYNQAIPVPQGTGAFYTMRYEGLPTMPIV